MAQIENPRKQFNFSVEIVELPLNPFLVQEIDIPDEEIEVERHGDTNHDIKTGGRKMIGQIPMKKLSTTDGSDLYIFDWMNSIADTRVGGGLTPAQYKRTLIISELAEDGATILNQWQAIGCFPSKRDAIELRRMSSSNTLESVTFEVDELDKL